MWIATAEHSKSIDRRAAEVYGLTPKILMERAGNAVFQAVEEMLPHGGCLAVVCGRGHNGGDGLAVARIATSRGYAVECLLAAEESALAPEAAEQLKSARAAGVQPVFCDDARWERRLDLLHMKELVVDALLGTGAHCEVRGPVKDAIRAINRSGAPTISIDVPSGILCDTGEELGESIWALKTVTIGLPKPFLFEGIGMEHAGYWSVADIDYPPCLLREPTAAHLIDPAWVASLIPERMKTNHKGENGSVLIVAGSRRMRGAAVLAARAAARSGAGLVTVAAIGIVCEAVAAAVPEALLLPLPESDGVVSESAVDLVLEAQGRHRAAIFGPGLTHEEPVANFLAAVWRHWSVPCVLDADALNAVSLGVEMPAENCVLTPHPGEMSRLLRSSVAEVQSDRFRAVDSAVNTFGRCVLLKGPHTISGEPGEPMIVNSTGNPGMASAGMGDVLCGVIGTLLAQELPPLAAAACGAYWHGASGDICAEQIGNVGYTASDVATLLPRARASIIATCETS